MNSNVSKKQIPLSKRVFDILLSALFILLFSPIYLILSILVLIYHGRPILFKHERPGLHGKIFTMYKFRTMSNAKDNEGNLLPDAERLTGFGRFLRSTSMDEFPEFFNVFLGDMSFVGPRPLLVQYLERYSPRQAKRHHVLPGITGWAQVNGRNNLSWEDKFALDVWYVENWSFWLDMKILIKTPLKVFKREGITSEGNATAKEFMGSDRE